VDPDAADEGLQEVAEADPYQSAAGENPRHLDPKARGFSVWSERLHQTAAGEPDRGTRRQEDDSHEKVPAETILFHISRI
jgi:hypothetical protein